MSVSASEEMSVLELGTAGGGDERSCVEESSDGSWATASGW